MVDARLVILGENRSDKAFRSAGLSMNRLTKQVSALAVAYGALRVTQKVIDIHRKFTTTISDLSAITGATGKQLEFLRKKSLEYGATTTLTASQAAEAFKLVASAKPDLLENAAALAAVTKQSIILAEASGSTLPEAAITLTLAMNQYGASADQAARFINVLAAGAKFGSSEIANTAAALKNSGLVARTAGTSFEELNAIIQVLAKSGIKAEEAGVGIRNIFLNLAIQTNDKFKPSVVGFTQAIKNMKAANLSTTELLKIFGKKNIVAAKAVIQHADALGVLTRRLTGTNTALDQANTKVDNLDGDIKRMNSQWEGVSLTLGKLLNPILRWTTQLLGWLSKAAKTVVIAFDAVSDTVGAAAASFTALREGEFGRFKEIVKQAAAQREIHNERLKNLFFEKEAVKQLTDANLAAFAAQSGGVLGEGGPAAAGDAGGTGLTEKDKKIIESLRLRVMTEREIEIARYEQQAQDLRDAEELKIIDAIQFDARIEKAKRKHEIRLTKISVAEEKKRSSAITSMRRNVAQLTVGLLQALAGKSKSAAIAAIALEKGLAIAQTVMNTNVAAMRALAELGPIAGAPVAAGIRALGAASVGLIAAQGLVQAGNVGGGGASLGTPANPVSTTQSPATVQPLVSTATQEGGVQVDPNQRTIILEVNGEIFGKVTTDLSRDGRLQISEAAIV